MTKVGSIAFVTAPPVVPKRVPGIIRPPKKKLVVRRIAKGKK